MHNQYRISRSGIHRYLPGTPILALSTAFFLRPYRDAIYFVSRLVNLPGNGCLR